MEHRPIRCHSKQPSASEHLGDSRTISELIKWLVGEGGQITLPDQLDRYLRANASPGKPRSLYVPPIMVPCYIMNPTGYSPIIQWYDRNPETIIFDWVSIDDAAPTIGAWRWTYTVPANRKAFLEFACCAYLRVTAAVAAQPMVSFITMTPAGGAETDLLYAIVETNVAGDRDRVDIGNSLILQGGDRLRGFTVDNSNGGTSTVVNNCKLTEFDA